MGQQEERKFIHDLATPLSAAIFRTDLLLESFQEKISADPEEMVQLCAIFESLEKIRKIINERREILINEQNAETPLKKER